MDKVKANERLNQIETEAKELRKLINSNGKITDRVKSYEDACDVLGISRKIFKGTRDEIAYKKLKVIVRALNEGWTPDFSNYDQYKYEPYFKLEKTGFVYFYYLTWSYVITSPTSLLFETSEKAQYAGNQFLSIYKDLHNL